jgi:hypothetical protein
MAKKIRGPVIIEPCNVPKQETMTTSEMMAPANRPSTGMRSAAVAAMRGDLAISGRGTR